MQEDKCGMCGFSPNTFGYQHRQGLENKIVELQKHIAERDDYLIRGVMAITGSKHGRNLIYRDDVVCLIEGKKPKLFSTG